MKVKMLKLTTYDGQLMQKDEIYDVPEDIAIRWKQRGIATVRKLDMVKAIEGVAVEAEAVEEVEEAEVGEEDVRDAGDDREPERVSGDKRSTRRGKQTTAKSK